VGLTVNKEGMIRQGLDTAQGNEKPREPLKPGARGLFETIDRLAQFTNIIGMSSIFKANRLFHIEGLVQLPMKEGIGDVQLPECPMMNSSQCKNSAHDRKFDHR
jgi:hypothetical protein